MKRIALVTLALAVPRLADAGHTCDHNGGGGSSNSGSSSSSTSSSVSSSSNDTSWSYRGAHAGVSSEVATGCIDDTDVVGYRHCTKYGEWAGNMRLPRLFIELGTNVRQFTSGLQQQQGQVTHGLESFAYRTVMADPTSAIDTAISSSFRFGFLPAHNFYMAVETELGGLASTATASTEMMSTGTFGGPQIAQQGGMFLGAYGVVGARGSTRQGTLAVEAAGGARSMMYHFDSTYHECETTSTITVTRAVVEARARAELWAGPWFTIGAQLGANMLAKGDWLAGLYLGIHSRAFAGSR